jgi:hypothetical protein
VGLDGFFIFSANAGCLRMEAHRRFLFYSPQDFKQKELIMKTKHGILFGFVALLLVTIFTFSGCKDEEDNTPAPPASNALTGTTWTATISGYSYLLTWKYVVGSKWEDHSNNSSIDQNSGGGSYELDGLTVTMKMTSALGTAIRYIGTLNSAGTSMTVKTPDGYDYGIFTKVTE